MIFQTGQRVKVRGLDFLHIPFARCAIEDQFERDYEGTVLHCDEYNRWAEMFGLKPTDMTVLIRFDDDRVGEMKFPAGLVANA